MKPWIWVMAGLGLVAAAATAGWSVFEQRRRSQEQLAQVGQAVSELERDVRASLTEGSTVTANAALGRMRETIDRVGGQAQGSDAIAMQAASAYLAAIQEATRAHADGVQALEGVMTTLTQASSPAAITRHRASVERFLEANRTMLALTRDPEAYYRREIEARNFPEKDRPQFMAGLRHSLNEPTAKRKRELGVKIRDMDEKIGTDLMATLDLLEQELGRWRAADDGTIVFDRDEAAERFTALMTGIEAAGTRQLELQAQFAEQLGAEPKAAPQAPPPARHRGNPAR